MPGIYTVPQLRETLAPVFAQYGIRRAVLFGSYGKGTATETSDVDLLMDSGPSARTWTCSTWPTSRRVRGSTGKSARRE